MLHSIVNRAINISPSDNKSEDRTHGSFELALTPTDHLTESYVNNQNGGPRSQEPSPN